MKKLTDLVARKLTPLIGHSKDVGTDQSDTQAPLVPLHDLRTPKKAPLSIEIPLETCEETERAQHHERGQHLARQEDWVALSAAIRRADHKRLTTSSGMPVADLLSYGARADVVAAAEHALFDGKPEAEAPVIEGITALEEVLQEYPMDYTIALIVAQTHMDLGWAWRGTGWEAEVCNQNLYAFHAHFDRAAEILDDLSGIELNAPSVAAANCALLAGRLDSRARVADDYEDLIDLAPRNQHPMRAMGYHLLPRWYGSYQTLELEARRTASRTQDIWGAGAYTWVYLDAITIDEHACAQLDVDFFIDGMKDILSMRGTQHNANLLAAYCAVTLRSLATTNDEAALVRDRLIGCADWIVKDHITELHPLIWAHASEGFDNAARVASVTRFAEKGKAAAMAVLRDLFVDDFEKGNTVVFGPTGVDVKPA